jgi:hypothetical protein
LDEAAAPRVRERIVANVRPALSIRAEDAQTWYLEAFGQCGR